MHSTFNTLTSIIERRTMQLYHHVSTKGGAHKLDMTVCSRVLDAYALERLKQNIAIGEISKEINKVFTLITDGNGFNRMIALVDTQFLHTACGLLMRDFRLSNNEARLALFLLQISTRRLLIAPAAEAKIDDTEVTVAEAA